MNDRDPITGYKTTGHNWNGITELNAPVPKVVLYFLAASVIYSIIAWVVLPAWPLGKTFTTGVWGSDQQKEADAAYGDIRAARAGWEAQILGKDFTAIRSDTSLMAQVNAAAPALFGENCQACHGARGRGGAGFPRLDDTIWTWGGTAKDIAETIRVGINSAHPDTRLAQMPAFGRSGMLQRPDIDRLTDQVLALADGKPGTEAGRKLFSDNCASCHGEDARGIEGTGAPNLTDADWLYGGSRQSILTTLIDGRKGQMPSWAGRLSEADIRILALYVEGLSGAAP